MRRLERVSCAEVAPIRAAAAAAYETAQTVARMVKMVKNYLGSVIDEDIRVQLQVAGNYVQKGAMPDTTVAR